MNDLVAVSSTIASSSTPAVDSPDFTFEGTAWDGATSQVVSQSFSLFTNVQSTSSAEFTLTNGSSTLLTISNLGDASVSGDLTVGKRLFLGSKLTGTGSTSTYIYVDDTLAPSATYIATNADGWSTSSTYDYAERYFSNDSLVPGELVTVDQAKSEYVKRASSPGDELLGIVSTKPGFITGGYVSGTYPIALAGRVPTKVSAQNGAIAIGDLLTLSSIPGVAMKATAPGETVGVALESFTGSGVGSIEVFVKSGWREGDVTTSGMLGGSTATPAAGTVSVPGVSARAGFAELYAGATEVTVNFASLNAYPLVSVTPYELPTGQWGVTQVTDHGFKIVLSKPESFDLTFSWKAEPSQSGDSYSYSDNTSASYDPTSGVPYGPLLPPTSTTQGTTSTVSSVSSTTTVSNPSSTSTSSATSTTDITGDSSSTPVVDQTVTSTGTVTTTSP
jgi:hypothetical protein